jgi:hypothetical protein
VDGKVMQIGGVGDWGIGRNIAKGSYAQGRGQKGFYCYVVVWAVKESPNRYGYSYTYKITGGFFLPVCTSCIR